MATNTYVAINTQTLSSATASVTFSSIPQTYTDLIIVCNGSPASGASGLITINNDTGSNYSYTFLTGYSGGVASGGTTNTDPANTFFGGNIIGIGANSVWQLHFNNYSNTTTNKTVLSRLANNVGNDATVLLYRSTAAITSIKLQPQSSINWNSGSTFTLYGIANSDIGAPKAFGGTITQDATYTYHTFGASGTFIPQQTLTCDYLVVASGGGGGSQHAGGGGAGGLRSTVGNTGGGGTLETAVSFASGTSYAISVGAGGAGSTNINNAGVNGNISSIIGGAISISSTAGGGGGSRLTQVNGATGGSGGGAGYLGTAGSGTNNQGYAGGASAVDGGGGGGAGQVGQVAVNTVKAGDGGNGVLITALATPTGTGFAGYYAGGGGGGGQQGAALPGLGGAGGGGNGTNTSATGANGVALSGSGGGGGGYGPTFGSGGNGGSGVVIIRYAN